MKDQINHRQVHGCSGKMHVLPLEALSLPDNEEHTVCDDSPDPLGARERLAERDATIRDHEYDMAISFRSGVGFALVKSPHYIEP
jgi:hypothetical protein